VAFNTLFILGKFCYNFECRNLKVELEIILPHHALDGLIRLTAILSI